MRMISAARTAALLGDAPRRSPAYAAIADGLQMLVSDGRIPSGTRLPSERELTQALGVSRTTVTRAYTRLRDAGYLESRQGSGSVTRLPTPAHVRDTLLDPGPAEPDVVDLTCAAPTAPVGVAAAYAAAVAELPSHLGEYCYYPTGLPALREAIAGRYAERGLPTDPEQVLVTPGALAGLSVVVRAFVAPGDRVLTESPTYPNAVATLRGARARVAGADIDQAGWGTTTLVDAVRQLRPASAYLMPDFQNPTGLLMDDEERERLAAALRRGRTLPVVDETMAEMALDDTATALPFAAHAADAVSVGSASKLFWGGLRLGWIRSPEPRMAELVAARLTLDLGAPPLEQLALLHLMEHRHSILEVRRSQLVASRGALVAALAERLPSWRYRVPRGGLSLWCELPRPAATALAAAAADHGVRIAPGPLFAPEGGLDRFVRLPFTRSAEELRLAVDRLAAAWEGLPRRAALGRRRRASETIVA
jgi:DNA-binding transcriptional MocR family regulator